MNISVEQLYGAALKPLPGHAHERIRFVSQVLCVSFDETVLALFKKRQNSCDAWDLPGGGVEPGENFLQAAKREIAEEIRFKVDHFYPLTWNYEVPAEHRKGYAALTFVCYVDSELSPVVDGSEHTGHLWRKLSQMPYPRTTRFEKLMCMPELSLMRPGDLTGIASRRHPPNLCRYYAACPSTAFLGMLSLR